MKVTHEIAAYTATGEPVFLFKVVNGAGAYELGGQMDNSSST